MKDYMVSCDSVILEREDIQNSNGKDDHVLKLEERRNDTNQIAVNGGIETSVQQSNEPATPTREKWGSDIEFILSCVGWSVGFGNVWRFPYLAYSNGGGAFLLPYFILLILVGKPMYFMELAIGQFCSLGPMGVWNCFPIARGIGAAMVVVSLIVSINYNVLMAYSFYYLGQSFRSVLPWSDCFEWWGADNATCYVRSNQTLCENIKQRGKSCEDSQMSITYANISQDISDEAMLTCSNASETAAEQFWKRYVLNVSPSINEMGIIKWDLTLCLFVSWIVIFFCLSKGVKSSGKVVYFTATFPYVILIAILIYGVTLDGASDGLYFLFVPKWKSLLDIKVWFAAAEQLFYSLGLAWGGLIMFGSYNDFHNKVHIHALFVSSLDFLTSIIAGVVIFSVLGKMAKETGLCVEDVVDSGQGLAFVAYPEALAGLWVPQLWTFLFFFMLLLLGVDSEFALLETVTTVIQDYFPKVRKYKTYLILFLCIICFLLGIPCVMQGGPFVFNIMDHYAGGFVLMFIGLSEVIAIMWGYGIKRFCADIEMMLGVKVNYYFKSSWLVFSPVILIFIFIYGMSEHKTLAYNGIPNPPWAEAIGWILAMLSISQIPIWAIIILIRNRKNLRNAIFPTEDWGPEDPVIRKQWLIKQAVSTEGIDNIAFKTNESEL